jgi:CheY-like chemotaxis protein
MDLVITDLKMSGMSGLDLLKRVKERSPSMPVIILTGFGDMDSVIAAMRAGVADYLKKPFAVNDVLEVVRRELKRKQFAEPSVAPQVAAAGALSAEPGQKPPRLYIFSQVDLAGIEKALIELRAQITAEAVLLLEEAGYVISAKGTLSESDVPPLATLVVSGQATTAQLARMLGEEQAFALNYLEGQRVGVYTAGLGKGLFLVLVVPKHVKQGAVWLYAKKAASEIEKIAVRALEKAVQAAPAEVASRQQLREELSTQAENIFRQELPAESKPSKPVQTLTFEEAMSQGLIGDMVKMMAQSPEPESSALATSTSEPAEPAQPVETLSFEEAMKRGLLGDFGQPPAAEPPGPEAAAPSEEPHAEQPTETLSFEEAMKMGLLGNLGQGQSE